MSNNPKPPSTPTTDLKVCQLQSYLHRSGRIAIAAHPFLSKWPRANRRPLETTSKNITLEADLDNSK